MVSRSMVEMKLLLIFKYFCFKEPPQTKVEYDVNHEYSEPVAKIRERERVALVQIEKCFSYEGAREKGIDCEFITRITPVDSTRTKCKLSNNQQCYGSQ